LNGIRESVVSQRDARIAATNGILVKANAVSNGASSVVLPVKRINGGLDDVVAQRAESRQDLAIGREVRWPHISGKDANDREQRGFQLGHLARVAINRQGSQIGVIPGMGCDLMTFVVHALNCWNIIVYGVVVLPVYEKGSFHPSRVEHVQHLVCVDIRPIIKSEGHGARNGASINDYPVWNR